jgi:hypothetical protein
LWKTPKLLRDRVHKSYIPHISQRTKSAVGFSTQCRDSPN